MTAAESPPILVVDDDESNRLLLRTFLKAGGYEVVEAETGEDALRRLAAGERVSLVLLDVLLPGLSGFEVCQQLRQNPATDAIPVIMVTALGDVESRTRAFDSDADEFLTKPVFRPELLARVRSILHSRQMQADKEAAQLALEGEKRSQLHALFERYVSKTVAEHLLSLPEDERVALLRHQRRVDCTVMFTDMRGFTAMADALRPDQVVAILNEHFNSLTEIAYGHGGTIFNMTGDGLLIGFGVPIPMGNPCVEATAAALEMQQDFTALRDKVAREHGLPIGLGIGLSHGPVIMGNVGSDHFLSFTIIGDTVNVAARAQALAGAGSILMTQAVHERIGSTLAELQGQALDPVVLKGKAQDQVLYRIAG